MFHNQSNLFKVKNRIKIAVFAIFMLFLFLVLIHKHIRPGYQADGTSNSFYQKLAEGHRVNILVVGDSIGAQPWIGTVQSHLKSTYGAKSYASNISMGGNTSYAGYVRTMTLADKVSYDLVILCYGQNDSAEDFGLYYEALLRAVKSKYNCSIISVLEHSQKEYTEKIKIIQDLADHYGVLTADTIAPFQSDYDNLTADGIHPNNAGQELYAKTVGKVIDQAVVNAITERSNGEVSAVNDEVTAFDTFKWYGKNKFNRSHETAFTLKTKISGILGIDYTFQGGINTCEIYVDGKLFKAPQIDLDYDFSQRHIMIVSNNCTVENEIKIVFNDKKQAKGFYGICFSGIN